MPSGSEKDVLRVVAEEGGETSLGTIIRNMRCYSGRYTRSIVYSLSMHDYLDWPASGRLVLTDKGRRALRISEEEWQTIIAGKEKRERESRTGGLRWATPMVSSELEALRKVKGLNRVTTTALSQEMGISMAQAGLLLVSLLRRGYISGSQEEGCELTPEGQSLLYGGKGDGNSYQ